MGMKRSRSCSSSLLSLLLLALEDEAALLLPSCRCWRSNCNAANSRSLSDALDVPQPSSSSASSSSSLDAFSHAFANRLLLVPTLKEESGWIGLRVATPVKATVSAGASANTENNETANGDDTIISEMDQDPFFGGGYKTALCLYSLEAPDLRRQVWAVLPMLSS
mmetsp:Transcript_16852/g.37342  ORF Transcript_16852/g.37342 Transcript_16852/m.37342 type:complete len:165 (-) Transcript_16852:34-528(-)